MVVCFGVYKQEAFPCIDHRRVVNLGFAGEKVMFGSSLTLDFRALDICLCFELHLVLQYYTGNVFVHASVLCNEILYYEF